MLLGVCVQVQSNDVARVFAKLANEFDCGRGMLDVSTVISSVQELDTSELSEYEQMLILYAMIHCSVHYLVRMKALRLSFPYALSILMIGVQPQEKPRLAELPSRSLVYIRYLTRIGLEQGSKAMKVEAIEFQKRQPVHKLINELLSFARRAAYENENRLKPDKRGQKRTRSEASPDIRLSKRNQVEDASLKRTSSFQKEPKETAESESDTISPWISDEKGKTTVGEDIEQPRKRLKALSRSEPKCKPKQGIKPTISPPAPLRFPAIKTLGSESNHGRDVLPKVQPVNSGMHSRYVQYRFTMSEYGCYASLNLENESSNPLLALMKRSYSIQGRSD